jgi:hypothetical protein
MLVLHAHGTAHAGLIVGNLDQTTANNASFVQFNTQFLAQEFNPGSQSYTLTSVVATLQNYIAPTTNLAELVLDKGGSPGTQVVANFIFPSVPTSNPGSPVVFNPTTSGVTLSPNTNYWFVLASTSGTGFYEWRFASQTTLTAGSVGTLGPFSASSDNGATWIPSPATRGLIQVNGTLTVTAVPEPSPLILGGLAGMTGVGAWLRGRRRDRAARPSVEP